MNYILLSTNVIAGKTQSKTTSLLDLFIGFLILEFVCLIIMNFTIRSIQIAILIIKGEISTSYYKEREDKFKLFSIDDDKASILCYLTIFPWLFAFLFCDDKEKISVHLTRGLFSSILFVLPIFGITKIISIIIAIIHIKRIVSNGYYNDDKILWDWFIDYYSNPWIHLLLSFIILTTAIILLCGLIFIFGYGFDGIYI